tara:strand:+ start:622 stop:1113 length:492 start_codon:yes stop_codon:yes gene_type:complete
MLKFTNLTTLSGSGARQGLGLKKDIDYYVADSKYGFRANSNMNIHAINDDYYAVWNKWPVLTGTVSNTYVEYDGTALNDIGIIDISFQAGTTATGSQELDVAIIRKSDRKAVRLTVTGLSGAAAVAALREPAVGVTGVTVTAIDPKDGPSTPETGRLRLLGYA